jgi:hypothetical protein
VTTVETEIATVRQQIGEGNGHLEKQEAMIARLDRVGDVASEAHATLSRLKEAQQLYVNELARLEGRLGPLNA